MKLQARNTYIITAGNSLGEHSLGTPEGKHMDETGVVRFYKM
jgi:hypothetical protein